MCFRLGSVSYLGPNGVEGGLGQNGESVYDKDVDE